MELASAMRSIISVASTFRGSARCTHRAACDWLLEIILVICCSAGAAMAMRTLRTGLERSRSRLLRQWMLWPLRLRTGCVSLCYGHRSPHRRAALRISV